MELPNVYQNTLNDDINNQQEYYYGNDIIHSNNDNQTTFKVSIDDKINKLFKDTSFVYKTLVVIKTKTQDYEVNIIGKTSNYIITYDNELIPIKDIIDIYKK